MIRIIFWFSFLGPYIGGVVILIFTSVSITFPLDSDKSIIFVIGKLIANILSSPFVGILSYPYAIRKGAIPMMLSGVLYWVVLEYLSTQNFISIKRILIGGVLGFSVSLIYFFYFPIIFLLSPLSEEVSDSRLWFMTKVGAISSAFCALLITNSRYSKFVSKA